ncbi:MAG: glycosyltransferase family 4 protein [Pseudomonadota bacterium]
MKKSLDIAHKIWRCLPRNFRQNLFRRLGTIGVQKSSGLSADYGRAPIYVVGLFSTASGLGEGARLMYAALRENKAAIDVSAVFRHCDYRWEASKHMPCAHDICAPVIVHINAPFFANALQAAQHKLPKKRRIIGYWAWELPQVPHSWQGARPFVYEVWVPSNFVRNALSGMIDVPIRVVPHPLPDFFEEKVHSPDGNGPSKGPFKFLVMFNCGSSFMRKNPLGAVRAYHIAFGDSDDVHLHIHALNPHMAPAGMAQLQKEIEDCDNISLSHEVLSQPDLWKLINDHDAIISLHRSEGFGLVPAQAMICAKPVIVTNWSGNMDFTTDENACLVNSTLVRAQDVQGTYDSKEMLWAEPDCEHAALHMRAVFDDPKNTAQKAAKARRDIMAHTSQACFQKFIQDLG